MKIKRLFEGPTAFEWLIIVMIIGMIIITMNNHRAVLAKAKADLSQLNK